MKFTKLVCMITAIVILALSLCSCSSNKVDIPAEMTTMEYVQRFGLGINLGNTFESCGEWISDEKVSNFETAWGSPIVTEEIIQGYADAGFPLRLRAFCLCTKQG